MSEKLELRQLKKQVNAGFTVGPLDFAVAAGERVLLTGPSGCGKTTLLRIIAGLEQSDGGTVLLDGRVVSGTGKFVHPSGRGIGFVFQHSALWPHLTVAENIAFGMAQADDRRVAELLAAAGLAGYEKRLPGTLSGGEARRVAVMRALAARPPILLLDEPTVWLDEDSCIAINRLLEDELAVTRATVILVTHEPEPGLRHDRHMVMTMGQCRAAGNK